MVISDLQMALIGAGVVAVGAVWAYNAWQERKARRAAQAIFKHAHGDTLLADEEIPTGETRREPVFPVDAAEPLDNALPDGDASIAGIAPDDAGTAMAVEPSTHSEFPGQHADGMIDCVLRLATAEPIPAPAVWVMQESWAAQLSKPVHWLLRDGATNAWRPLDGNETGRYAQWVAALQLADRHGAVSEGELAHFLNGVQQVADKVGATVELPAPEQIIAHATALDEFCASVDIQFKLHIVESAGGIFSGTKLRGIAEAAGMALEADGRFHARDADGGELFTLANLGSEGLSIETLRSLATHGLTLSIDVPRVSDGAAAFARMLGTGQQLARAMDGVLVDAQRVPLADGMISAIRAKIVELQQTMRNAGIIPGSALALRLFS
ncbi:MAG: cell division protein ZipA C-terminal FtsZ-binding domain-containing protein [Rugosibacter sp.]